MAFRSARTFALAFGLAASAVLGLAGLSPVRAQGANSEAVEFGRANSCELLRAFVAKYPSGRFIGQARAAIAQRNCPDPQAAMRKAQRDAEDARAREADLRRQLEIERNRRIAAERVTQPKVSTPALPPAITTAPRPTVGADTGPFGLDLLHPDVRAAVVRARAEAARAESAAASARNAVQLAEAARNRARAKAAGTNEYDYGDGRRYAGDWSNGKQNGYGEFTVSGNRPTAGDRYAGQYRDGLPNGVGAYWWGTNTNNPGGNAQSYEGQWVQDLRTGVGVQTWRSSARYAGAWSGGKISGPGVYRFRDGARFEGDNREDKENGLGVMWSADGRLEQAGEWRDGQLIRAINRF